MLPKEFCLIKEYDLQLKGTCVLVTTSDICKTTVNIATLCLFLKLVKFGGTVHHFKTAAILHALQKLWREG